MLPVKGMCTAKISAFAEIPDGVGPSAENIAVRRRTQLLVVNVLVCNLAEGSELELIQTDVTQKQLLRLKWCACVRSSQNVGGGVGVLIVLLAQRMAGVHN